MLRNISDQPKSNLCPAKQCRYFVGQVINKLPPSLKLRRASSPTLQLRPDKQHRHFVGQVKNKLPPTLKNSSAGHVGEQAHLRWKASFGEQAHLRWKSSFGDQAASSLPTGLSAVSLAENPKPETRNLSPRSTSFRGISLYLYHNKVLNLSPNTCHLSPLTNHPVAIIIILKIFYVIFFWIFRHNTAFSCWL